MTQFPPPAPAVPQHLHILSTTRSFMPVPSIGSSKSPKSSKKGSLIFFGRYPVAYVLSFVNERIMSPVGSGGRVLFPLSVPRSSIVVGCAPDNSISAFKILSTLLNRLQTPLRLCLPPHFPQPIVPLQSPFPVSYIM